jgi:hypothetical protein
MITIPIHTRLNHEPRYYHRVIATPVRCLPGQGLRCSIRALFSAQFRWKRTRYDCVKGACLLAGRAQLLSEALLFASLEHYGPSLHRSFRHPPGQRRRRQGEAFLGHRCLEDEDMKVISMPIRSSTKALRKWRVIMAAVTERTGGWR